MTETHPVVLFDGVCNLCNGFVQFCIERDKKGKLKFASLQSGVGQELLAQFGLKGAPLSTVVLIEGNQYYTKSSAGLRVLKHFGGFWQLFYGLMIFPKPLRNWVYDYIAKNRYKWFGKKESCWMPTPELENRFL